MTWLFARKHSATSGALIGQFVTLKAKVDQLPPLSAAAKAGFDHEVDIDHLYYSSKIEGTNLTTKEIKRAVLDEKGT